MRTIKWLFGLVSLSFFSCSTDSSDIKSIPNNSRMDDLEVSDTSTQVNDSSYFQNSELLISSPSENKTESTSLEDQKINNSQIAIETDQAVKIDELSNPEIIEEKISIHDHLIWNELLMKHVNSSGKVNYKGFAADKVKLQEYVTLLEFNAPTSDWSKQQKMAFWINAYNAFTVKTIVDKYPVKSIMDIDKAWDKKIWKVGNAFYSLSQIENDILRKMNDSRIHFAINCASVSCPKLYNKSFTSDQLESQLKKVTNDFINDSKKNIISENKIQISKIFEWYATDFEDGNIIEYLNKFVGGTIQSNASIGYLEYDWGLNE